jgi:HAD superfamily hydrolase (TIGR01490 family)
MRLALFDLDNTLLSGDSNRLWLQFLIGRGVVDRGQEQAATDIERRFTAGEISVEESSLFYIATLGGRERSVLDVWHLDFMRDYIVPNIPQQALELLAQHRDAGDLVVMTTSTNRFITEPIAAYLAVEHLIATDAESMDGRFTGKYSGILNMREGKVKRLDTWLAERGYSWLDFAETWFYSDSRNDIPLLDRVSRPVAVDPDPALAAHARSRGWPVLRLRQSGT